jgi:Flp pilus assembly protein TadG
MLRKINSFFSRVRNNDERGSSELPVTLIMLPFAIFLIFALIDVTFYMQTRSNVQAVLRDATRAVALYGGNSSTIPLNTLGKNVDTYFTEKRIYTPSKGCLISYCGTNPTAPKITCTPSVATVVGQEVKCSIKYNYSPVANDSYFGFSGWTKDAFTMTETSISETRY